MYFAEVPWSRWTAPVRSPPSARLCGVPTCRTETALRCFRFLLAVRFLPRSVFSIERETSEAQPGDRGAGRKIGGGRHATGLISLGSPVAGSATRPRRHTCGVMGCEYPVGR
jgi:hypothetical protein